MLGRGPGTPDTAGGRKSVVCPAHWSPKCFGHLCYENCPVCGHLSWRNLREWDWRVATIYPHCSSSATVTSTLLSQLPSWSRPCCVWGGLLQQSLTWTSYSGPLLQFIPPAILGAHLWSCHSSAHKPWVESADHQTKARSLGWHSRPLQSNKGEFQ